MIDVVMPIYQALEPECFISLLGMLAVEPVNFIVIPRKSDIVQVRNELRAEVLKAGHEFSLWIDADISFPRDGMRKLMSEMVVHSNAAVMTGLYRQRLMPHACCAWRWHKEDDAEGFVEAYKGQGAVFEVDACGAGFMLVRNRALLDADFCKRGCYSEDISFCTGLKEKGWRIYAHGGVRCGHVTNHVLEV